MTTWAMDPTMVSAMWTLAGMAAPYAAGAAAAVIGLGTVGLADGTGFGIKSIHDHDVSGELWEQVYEAKEGLDWGKEPGEEKSRLLFPDVSTVVAIILTASYSFPSPTSITCRP